MAVHLPDIPSPIRETLELASLAPSSHNSQPWGLEVTKTGDSPQEAFTITVFADETRRLEVADPHGRELNISCGTYLYNLVGLLEEKGCKLGCSVFHPIIHDGPSEGDEQGEGTRFQPVATVDVILPAEEGASNHGSSFAEAVKRRRTDRRAYDAQRTVDKAVMDKLKREVEETGKSYVEGDARGVDWGVKLHIITDESMRDKLSDLVHDAGVKQFQNKAFRNELSDWLRYNRSSRKDGLFGYASGVSTPVSLLSSTVVKFFNIGAGICEEDRRLVLSSPLLLLLSCPTSGPATLMMGYALQKLLILLQSEGLSAAYCNQPLQLKEERKVVEDLLGVPANTSQLLLRVGYPSAAVEELRAVPRRPLDELLIEQ